MKNQYDPLQCLKQLSQQMNHLCIEVQFLKERLDRYSSEEISRLIPQVIEKYIQNPKFGEEVKKQARDCLEKFKVSFREKFKNQETSFLKLTQEIDNQIQLKSQGLENSFQCETCHVVYPTINGLHYHQKYKERLQKKEKRRGKERKDKTNVIEKDYIKTRRSKKNDPDLD